MLLKRNYDMPEGWEPERAEDGTLRNPLPVKSLSVKHTGTHPAQNFSRRLIDTGLAEGWVSLSKGRLTLHTEDEDLEYHIVRMPGTYCCHCDMKLEDDTTGTSGRQHLATAHAGDASPDPHHPAGFRVTNAYECVLGDEQHDVWNHARYMEARREGHPLGRQAPARKKRVAKPTNGEESKGE